MRAGDVSWDLPVVVGEHLEGRRGRGLSHTACSRSDVKEKARVLRRLPGQAGSSPRAALGHCSVG